MSLPSWWARRLPLLAVLVACLAGGTVVPVSVAAAGAGSAEPEPPLPELCVTPDEEELIRLIDAHRSRNGLPAAPVSLALTLVAKAHVYDLAWNLWRNIPLPARGVCNLHSWSSAGSWSPVCSTRDLATAPRVWSKPMELTGGRYGGRGFENAYWTAADLTPRGAFDAWLRSPHHEGLISQRGDWQTDPWPAMGVAMLGHYAVVWFGEVDDPLGEAPACAQGRSVRRGRPGGGETGLRALAPVRGVPTEPAWATAHAEGASSGGTAAQ